MTNFHGTGAHRTSTMIFDPALGQALIEGKRPNNPALDLMFKRAKKATSFNFTTSDVYKKMMPEIPLPVPRMHSFYVPQYLKLKKWQAEAAREDGFRLVMKWKSTRVFVRFNVICTFSMGIYTALQLYCLLRANR